MPHVDDIFPTRFISAGDLAKVKDKTTPFVIQKVVKEACMNPRTKKEEDRWIVYFQGVKKGHRLRKSEIKALGAALGETTEQWTGKSVTLFSVSTQTGAGVRMKPVQDKGADPDAEDLSFDDKHIPKG